MAGFHIRRAVESDLPRLYDIWYHDEVAGEEDTPRPARRFQASRTPFHMARCA